MTSSQYYPTRAEALPLPTYIDEEEMDGEHVKYISYYRHHQADIDDDDVKDLQQGCGLGNLTS